MYPVFNTEVSCAVCRYGLHSCALCIWRACQTRLWIQSIYLWSRCRAKSSLKGLLLCADLQEKYRLMFLTTLTRTQLWSRLHLAMIDDIRKSRIWFAGILVPQFDPTCDCLCSFLCGSMNERSRKEFVTGSKRKDLISIYAKRLAFLLLHRIWQDIWMDQWVTKSKQMSADQKEAVTIKKKWSSRRRYPDPPQSAFSVRVMNSRSSSSEPKSYIWWSGFMVTWVDPIRPVDIPEKGGLEREMVRLNSCPNTPHFKHGGREREGLQCQVE